MLVSGPATIAQLTGAPLLAMVFIRSADWRHQVLEISPVPVGEDSEHAFRQCLAIIETAIRRFPGQWLGWSLIELAILGLVSPAMAGVRREDIDKITELDRQKYCQ